MRKTVFTYGLISGIISAGFLFGSMLYMKNRGTDYLDNGMMIGYASMLLSFILIYFAQASYRDNIGNGHITYGKAFQVGLIVTVISCLCYTIAWMFISAYIVPDFMEKYQEYSISKMQSSGMTAAQIAKKSEEMKQMAQLYKNPFFKAGITFLEPFPVGLVVTLISSFIVRIKRKTSPAVR